MEGQGSEATVLLEATGTPHEIAEAYHRVAKDLYWKNKDLTSARSALALGIAYAVDQARISDEPDELKGKVKAMCYDLASFCWPGWDEPGILIGETDLEVGEHAAHENLRLAIELQRGDLPMANAHFMVGAYHLARRRHAFAESSFEEFQARATAAGDIGAAILAEGYLALVRPGADILPICARLREEGGESGGFFAEQLLTAARVFG